MATGKKRRFRKDKLFKRGRIWWTRIAGKPVSTGCSDTEAASQVRQRLELEASQPAYATAHATSIDDMIDHVMADRKLRPGVGGKPVSASTLRNWQTTMGHIARILGSDTPIVNIGPDQFAHYIATRLQEGAHQHTLYRECVKFRAALYLEQERGSYPHNVRLVSKVGRIAKGYTPRKDFVAWENIPRLIETLLYGNRVRWETIATARRLHDEGRPFAEIGHVMGVATPTAHRYVKLSLSGPHPRLLTRAQTAAWMIATGSRRSEAWAAEMRDHDLVNWTVYMRGTKTEEADAVIPIAPPFQPLLTFALAGRPSTGPLFPKWPGIWSALQRACKRINIRPITPNTLRRTHMSLLSQAGVPHSVLKNVSRHTTTEMLDRIYGQQTLQSTAQNLSGVRWGHSSELSQLPRSGG